MAARERTDHGATRAKTHAPIAVVGALVCLAAMALATAASLAACGGTSTPEHSSGRSYVLVDGQARAAGVHVEGADPALGALPIEVAPGDSLVLVGPRTRTRLVVAPNEVLYVQGEDVLVQRSAIGREIAADGLVVVATEEAARIFAERVGGIVQGSMGSLWEVRGPGVLRASAHVVAPDGLVEAIPAMANDLPVAARASRVTSTRA